ncbi:MAG: prolyl oligopeptidase family serine peptidase [Crocinitomix sp.]|nr:prolyl oligopeptidase family serine peptidase [Crocinitomix sp.]
MRLFPLLKTTISAIILIISFAGFSQESALKLSEIMKGNEFIGHQPTDFSWGPNSEYIYFRWNRENELVAPYYVYSIQEKFYNKLQFKDVALPISGAFKGDNKAYFKSGSSIYTIDSTDNTECIYTATDGFRMHAIIEDQVVILRENNLYVLNTSKGTYTQLTNILTGNTPAEDAELTHLEQQQEELFETIRVNKAKSKANSDYRKLMTPQFLKPFYLDGWSFDDIAINEVLNTAALIRSKYPKNPTTAYMAYVTKDGNSTAKDARNKVGGENPQHELFIWHLAKDTFVQVDFSALSGVDMAPEFYSEYPDLKTDDYKKELIYHLHGFNESGNKCLISIKSYDNKDRWIGYYDLNKDQFIETNHQHDAAWIGGPGITGWNMVSGNVGWMDDECYYFQSEETGYSHLYVTNTKSQATEALTKGEYEIHEAVLSEDKTKFYISANKNHPGNREFYHLDIKSKKLTKILTENGKHEVLVSPNEKWLLVNYSYKNKPWDLYLAENKPDVKLEQITKSQSDAFKNYKWRSPPTITFKASDGQEVHARIYEPTEAAKNGAAVFFVHGAGYLQNAHNWWSGYYREYMFNNMLCDKGYTVMDIDFRASKGYGRDFRTDIYRHMGGKDLSDYVDARELLIKDYDIDPNRIGMYGGSYGGFITIMALLTEPGKFKCGAAVRSVTDWAHYNHAYTSNILNTPAEDPKAFKKSSPIYFADNLEDRLLMLHGMVDNNVQYQDVVRLAQRFIESGKTDWDLVGYPIEPHGFKETSSWVNEYGRVLKMFDEELLVDGK